MRFREAAPVPEPRGFWTSEVMVASVRISSIPCRCTRAGCGRARRTWRHLSSPRSNLASPRAYQCYGLPDTTSISTCERPDDPRRALGSAGQALPICSIRIDNEDELGRGEKLVQGENLLTRYLDLPELTAQRLDEGWLHTGDVGCLDDEGSTE